MAGDRTAIVAGRPLVQKTGCGTGSGTSSATIVGHAVTSSFECAWRDSAAIVRLTSIGGTANGEGAGQDS